MKSKQEIFYIFDRFCVISMKYKIYKGAKYRCFQKLILTTLVITSNRLSVTIRFDLNSY